MRSARLWCRAAFRGGLRPERKSIEGQRLSLYAHNTPVFMSNQARDHQSTHASSDELEAGSDPERLKEKSFLLADADADSSEVPDPDVEALRRLVAEVDQRGATYQSVAVAAVQILERALCYERDVAEAALSLGQQEKMEAMVATADQAVSVLRDTLSAQGHKVMHLCTEQSPPEPNRSRSAADEPWWLALSDALEVLEEGTDRMSTLTTGQPSGSPARELSQTIAQLLQSHHDALLLEADDWIS